MKQEKHRVFLITLGTMMCFLLFGYCDAIRGASLANVIDNFGVGYSIGGLLMVVHFTGYCTSSLLFGALAGKVEKKITPIIANTVILIGIFIYTQTANIGMFSIGVLCIGFGLGLYEFAGNTITADIYSEEKRGKYANLVAGMHGVGAIIGPALFGVIVKSGGSYKDSFGAAVPLMVFVILLFFIISYPAERHLKDEPLPITEVFKALGRKEARKYYIVSTLYIAVESGVITWTTVFLAEERGYSMDQASLWLSLFFVFLTAGRFAGSTFVDKIGYRNTLLYGFAISIVCIVCGICLPGMFIIFLPLSGLFLSVLFPTLGASISVECKENTSVCIGAFFAFAALGGALGSYVAGQVSQFFGVKAGLFSTVIFGMCALVIVWKTFRKNVIVQNKMNTEKA